MWIFRNIPSSFVDRGSQNATLVLLLVVVVVVAIIVVVVVNSSPRLQKSLRLS